MDCILCHDGELIFSSEKNCIICSNNITCCYEDILGDINEFHVSFIKETCIERDELREFKELKEARDDGSKRFYEGWKEEDNPYKETYIKPEHIMKGVNDRLITDYDKIQLKLESEWHNGWIEENDRFKENARKKELIKELIKARMELNTKTHFIINKFYNILLNHSKKISNLSVYLPFFRRDIKKKLNVLINELSGEVSEIRKDFPEK